MEFWLRRLACGSVRAGPDFQLGGKISFGHLHGGILMRQPCVDDFVRLLQDIPELGLIRNEVGVVRSTWFAPSVAYEVEFHPKGQGHQTRALLLAQQVQVEDGPLFERSPLAEHAAIDEMSPLVVKH